MSFTPTRQRMHSRAADRVPRACSTTPVLSASILSCLGCGESRTACTCREVRAREEDARLGPLVSLLASTVPSLLLYFSYSASWERLLDLRTRAASPRLLSLRTDLLPRSYLLSRVRTSCPRTPDAPASPEELSPVTADEDSAVSKLVWSSQTLPRSFLPFDTSSMASHRHIPGAPAVSYADAVESIKAAGNAFESDKYKEHLHARPGLAVSHQDKALASLEKQNAEWVEAMVGQIDEEWWPMWPDAQRLAFLGDMGRIETGRLTRLVRPLLSAPRSCPVHSEKR